MGKALPPKFLKLRLAIAISGLLTFSLLSCAPKLIGMWQDPDFTQARLKSAPIVLGGIGSSIGNEPDSVRLRIVLDSLAWSVFKQELPELDLAPLEIGRRALAGGLQESLMGSFQSKGFLDSLELTRLSGAFDSKQVFVIFGRICENRVDVKTVTESSSTWDEYTRKMTIHLAVYSAATGRLMWNGGISDKRTQSVDHTSGNTISSVGDFIGGLVADLLFPSPTGAPSSTAAAVAIFRVFARTLAGKQ